MGEGSGGGWDQRFYPQSASEGEQLGKINVAGARLARLVRRMLVCKTLHAASAVDHRGDGMQFGLQLNSQHPATENMRGRLVELLEQVRLAQAVGFHSVVAPQHYLPTPFQMLQPLPLLARVAAEADKMRLIAGIILLSLQNPVALAEEVGTLDAICNGQFTLGVALGYRQAEFQAFGVAKADAVPRLIEVLTVLKRLWTEEKVDHEGRFFTIPGLTLTTRPVQQPHPPIWMGADSDPAVMRAARLADTWYINPHAKLETLERQMGLYRQTLADLGKPFPREIPIRRELFV
ncbi:MAG: LLM class flavin-dependent oxidoreductase, partial [Planctomycetaceae bacterium]